MHPWRGGVHALLPARTFHWLGGKPSWSKYQWNRGVAFSSKQTSQSLNKWYRTDNYLLVSQIKAAWFPGRDRRVKTLAISGSAEYICSPVAEQKKGYCIYLMYGCPAACDHKAEAVRGKPEQRVAGPARFVTGQGEIFFSAHSSISKI